MKITITSGVGVGKTPLAAFDTALLDAGVGNYNLLSLSSVIPPKSTLSCNKHVAPEGEYGHRLYVVISSQAANEPGQEAWAGLGWVQDEEQKGLFVELHGDSELQVRQNINDTLETMVANRNYCYGPIQQKVAGIRCTDQPACAVVIAVYESQQWTQ